MGVAVGDADGDGREDLFVVNLMREGATLFRKESVTPAGMPVFVDITRQRGPIHRTFPYTGFGVGWIDYDNDGALDFFVANGAVTLREEQRGQPAPYQGEKPAAPQRRRKIYGCDGAGGRACSRRLGIARGAAFGDIDNDGRVDILVTNNNGPATAAAQSVARRKLAVGEARRRLRRQSGRAWARG